MHAHAHARARITSPVSKLCSPQQPKGPRQMWGGSAQHTHKQQPNVAAIGSRSLRPRWQSMARQWQRPLKRYFAFLFSSRSHIHIRSLHARLSDGLKLYTPRAWGRATTGERARGTGFVVGEAPWVGLHAPQLEKYSPSLDAVSSWCFKYVAGFSIVHSRRFLHRRYKSRTSWFLCSPL